MHRAKHDVLLRYFSSAMLACLAGAWTSLALAASTLQFVDQQLAEHPKQSGAYVLDSAEEALIARAWLADHAERSIEVQYFIWSSDNIGILAAEALLRAADRGVKVRVIVDDLLMDAPPDYLRALSAHPNFDIRIYNPKVSVGVPLHKRIWNAVTDLRAVNQRMHDKTFIVDGKVAITGGRNMAAEYYDYHQEYNFRDRDALLAGDVVHDMQASFERFWSSDLTVALESILSTVPSKSELQTAYGKLHAYAQLPENYAPAVRDAVMSAEQSFDRIAKSIAWGRVEFICDVPGKNASQSLNGGGRSSKALSDLLASARERVLIQSPYLVPSDNAVALFKQTMQRGVKIDISTNSLASTDNLQAFAGYRNQRKELLDLGINIFEYRPNAQTQRQMREHELVGQLPAGKQPTPIFGLHAKTMSIDGRVVFIGTFNLDPRSENLNTEVGVIIYSETVASAVENAIRIDMQPANSWRAASDDPDQYTPLTKRAKVRMWQWTPIKPLL